jgi:hypothetical protein
MEEAERVGQAKFNANADACLAKLYTPVGASTTEQKIHVLERELGGQFNFYALGGNIDDDMKLACLEYEYLERMGQVELVFA